MKLALGTVQFGLNYGITNTSGKVSSKEVRNILNFATNNSLTKLDTASAYGNSQNVLGDLADNRFDIISKIPSFKSFKGTIQENVKSTLKSLKRDNIYGMMLHDEADILDKTLYNDLLDLQNRGVFKKVGCSFYSIEALEFAFNKNLKLDIIQIPASCLDQRFEQTGLLYKAKEKGLEVHCRSIFLQGILLSRNEIPLCLQKFKNEIDSFHNFADYNSITPLELCLMYLFQNEFLDFGVVGCQSEKQLKEIITSYKSIENMKLNLDLHQLSSSSEILLNPTLWN